MGRHRRLMAAALSLMAVGGACADDGRQAAPTTTTRPAQGAWRPIPAGPVDGEVQLASVWAGDRMVVWGQQRRGDELFEAGAAWDPTTGRWETLPPSPLSPRAEIPLWTGTEMIVWSGLTVGGGNDAAADGAAYNPATKTWRTISPAPIGGRAGHEAVWTGTEMLVWGGLAQCCSIDSTVHQPEAAAYDPATDTWRRIADVPEPWAGDDGTAVTLADRDGVLVWREHRLVRYDLAADGWSEVEGAPPPQPSRVTTTGDPVSFGAVLGGDFYGWSGGYAQRPLRGVRHQPATGQWSSIPALDGTGGSALVSADERLYLAIASAPPETAELRIARYEPGAEAFTELPSPDLGQRTFAQVHWTGRELIVWGGYGDSRPAFDGAVWREG